MSKKIKNKKDLNKTIKKDKKTNKTPADKFSFSEDRKKIVYDLIYDEHYSPMKEKEIAIFLQVKKEDRNELSNILEELIKEGLVSRTNRGRYEKSDTGIVGNFISNPKGFGFVSVEGYDEDIYISEEDTNGAFFGDMVSVRLKNGKTGDRMEGVITRVVMHTLTSLVGTYESSKTYGFVIPDNKKIGKDIFIYKEKSKGAVDGDKVVVELTYYGDDLIGRGPEGKVVDIIGNINDPGVDILSIVKGYDIPYEFPERVKNQALRTADSVSEADMQGRMDLRNVQMVTIDGEDSKDLDDAVSVTIDDKGLYHLGVHIADVANYVQEGSALDREALKRGTSVYLVDRVIPMLPHKLSNGICSLNHGEDRLSLSCLMTINDKGDIIDHEIVESVINVDERMTYTSVAKIILDHDEEEMKKYENLVPMFEDMYTLAKILRKKRHDRGAVDFDSTESKIILDSEGNPIDIKPYERNDAHVLIEDFMLAANETVAAHFFWLSVPFLYRTHEKPSLEKIETLKSFIRGFGYYLNVRDDDIKPMEIQKLLTKVEGTSEEGVISKMTLRSMMQAKYTTECLGHFGLALSYYCHFTSPIRRYPDLQIHRIIKDFLRGRLNESKIEHYSQILPEIAKHCSDTERRADDAERDTDKLKKAQFMENHIGELFEGIISSVTGWGIFVELENTCEGLIRLADLNDDYYIYDADNMLVYGERYGREYKLGQKVMVKVIGADRIEKTVDFAIVTDIGDVDDIKLKRVSKPLYMIHMEEKENGYLQDDDSKNEKSSKRAKNKENKNEKSTGRDKNEGTKKLQGGRKKNIEHTKKKIGKSSKKYKEDIKNTVSKKNKNHKNSILDEFDFDDGADLSILDADDMDEGLKRKILKEYEPDSKTGKLRKKSRKKYAVHKFKKSATSKAARDTQKKGKRKK